jgi:hypothetical protein
MAIGEIMWKKVGNFLTSRITLGVAVCAFAWLAWHNYNAKPPVKLVGQTQLNDSTVAAPANTSLGRHELPALTDAASALNGKLIAGVSFHTKAETTIRPLKEVTTSTAVGDSTRKASLDTTTALGIALHVDAEAPAFPAPLKLGYTLSVPSFNPKVGFVETGDTYAATVTWSGQSITIDDAFVLPKNKWNLVVGATVLADSSKIHSPEVYLGLNHRLGRKYEFSVQGVTGLSKDKELRVGIQRDLLSW